MIHQTTWPPTEAARRNALSQFYAQEADEQKCLRSSLAGTTITINGRTTDGVIRVFTGIVQSVEKGHTVDPGYPLRITMPNSN